MSVIRGENAKDAVSGGGAGGSLLVDARNLEGTGSFDVRGGDGGLTFGGGGSGGIAAIYFKKSTLQFSHKLRGGSGKTVGASGFLYYKKTDSHNEYTQLILEGSGHLSLNSPSVLVCDPKIIDFTFDEIKLFKSSTLTMVSCSPGSPLNLITTIISGDKSAWLVVQPDHDVFIGVTGIALPNTELQFNAEIKDGGTISVPSSVVISSDTQLSLGGSLDGIAELTIERNGSFELKYPGHTGYRIMPQRGISSLHFSSVRIKNGGRMTTASPNKVKLTADLLQLDYGGHLAADIILNVKKKEEHINGPPLNRQDCPHGYEVVELASETLYDPCGEGRRVWKKSNVSYLVFKNISIAISPNETMFVIINETHYNVTYYIACDYDNFRLLPGQSCTLAYGTYSYNSLEIQGGATLAIEAATHRVTASILHVSKLSIYSDGSIIAKKSNFENVIPAASGSGGSYGGLGGGESNRQSLYGNISLPTEYGSRGGGSSIRRGEGGGVINLHVRQFINDGLVDASGGLGTSGAGAGSGGSVLVTTDSLKGNGMFKARGGDSIHPGGGGGGGRIAIIVRRGQNEFQGNYDATGGSGSQAGSSGTVLIRDLRHGMFYETLLLRNQGIGYPPVILPKSRSSYIYDEIRVESHETLLVTSRSLTAKSLVTDGTGKISVSNGSRVDILNFPGSSRNFACDLEIQSGASFYIHSKCIFTGPSSLAVTVAGLLQATEPVLGESKVLRVTSTGELRSSTLKLLRGSSVNLDADAKIKKSLTQMQFHVTSLLLDTDSHLVFAGENITFMADAIHLRKGASLTSGSTVKVLNIIANDVVVDSQAKITADNGGLIGGPGRAKSPGGGCGHGGAGGGLNGGTAYGSVFEPQHFGSGNNIRGGGILYLIVKGTLTLFGSISAHGGNDSSGGASGGSILIRTGSLSGHGEIASNGGEGNRSAGGSGGRIGLYVTDKSFFTGSIFAFGGCGSSCGAAGTIFIREYVVGLAVNSTTVDNGMRETLAKTAIMHEKKISYTVRLLKLINGARLEVASVPNVEMKIAIQNVEGDRSGTFHVRSGQTLTLGTGKAVSSRPFLFPWAMMVDEGATLDLAPVLFITRTVASPSLYLAGKLIGGQDVTVGQDASMVITKTGLIGTHVNVAGRYFFSSLKVSSGGRIKFEGDKSNKVPVVLKSISIDVAFGGVLEGRYLKVQTPLLNIAFNGSLVSDGLGNPPGVGLAAGRSSTRSGGDYGGCGGGEASQDCRVYGSMFKASEFGSGGGTSSNQGKDFGAGGGIITVEAATVVIDGIISSNGQNSDNTTTGGGSGGSVDISVTRKLSGRGRVEAQGGNGGVSVTGAGGGGRISLFLTGENKYKGVFSARGGNSSTNKSGSPGTVHIEEARTALRTRTLLIDNRGVYSETPLPVFLNESSVVFYTLKELQLYGKVILHLEKDMKVDKLLANSDSVIHVQDNVVVTVEPTSSYLKPFCSFHIDRDGEIRVPNVVTFLGSDNVIKGTLTGILDMIIGENRKAQFSDSARTARFIDGKYTFLTKRGEYRFSSLRIKNNAVFAFEDAILKKVPLTVGTLELNFGATLHGSWLDIQASDVIVHAGATIDLSGQGHASEAGPGAGGLVGNSGTGAGYGGYGGMSSNILGTWYGSALNPNATGSGGGSSSFGLGGEGGGYLHLTIVRRLRLEGTISVIGRNGKAFNSGGGSGGSVWIAADDIVGNGIVTSDGGNGNAQGGGGSAGRVAIFLKKKMSFEGLLRSRGGIGQQLGAAGTVYVQDNNRAIHRTRLWVDNRLTSDEKPQTVLYEPNMVNFFFDELRLKGTLRFEIYNLQRLHQTIKVSHFTSDGIGEIAIRTNQTLLAEVLEAKESHLTLTTNIYVEEGANLVVASNLTIDGATLTLQGKLSNVRHLVVESGSTVKFGITSQTALMEGKNFVFQSDPGTQQFASVILKSGSDFGAPLNLKISVGKLDMKNGVILRGKIIEINCKTLLIGRGATLTTNNSIEKDGTGGGHGRSSANGGSGGGHGSDGGNGYHGLAGGNAYDTLYQPGQPGRAGGDGSAVNTAGKGGGVIQIVTDILENDGYITANGGHASQGSNAGGGSGGSIFLSIGSSFSGTGTLSATGGRGDASGGCGAGGRIAIHLNSQFSYRGSLKALGGISVGSGRPGGPGTVYIQDVRYKLPYNQLRIDNQDQEWGNYITLNESKSTYDFNEVHLVRKASVRMIQVTDIGETLTLKIGKLFGDRSGLLHLYQYHKGLIEVREAQLTTTKTPVNFRIEGGAEAVMATTVYVVGDGAVALQCNGTISGVRNFYVTQKRVVKLQKGSRTSRDDEPPGTFIFSNLKLFSGSSMTMEDEVELKMVIGFLNVKFHASLEAHHLRILTSSLDVETGGLLSVAGENKARQIVPSSEVSDLPQGAGAGHASNGGEGYRGGAAGLYYGSLYQPIEPGRRGGNGPGSGVVGGSGGGYIVIEVGNVLINDGTITAAGESGSGGNGAGGGSGGSLFFTTDILTGKHCFSPVRCNNQHFR